MFVNINLLLFYDTFTCCRESYFLYANDVTYIGLGLHCELYVYYSIHVYSLYILLLFVKYIDNKKWTGRNIVGGWNN